MYDIAIDIVHLKTSAACLESRRDSLGAMVCVPQLRGNEQVLPPDVACLQNFLNSNPDLFLISVAFCAVEMAKSYFQRVLNRLFRDRGIFIEQRAKSNGRHLTNSVYKQKFCIAKCIMCHTFLQVRRRS